VISYVEGSNVVIETEMTLSTELVALKVDSSCRRHSPPAPPSSRTDFERLTGCLVSGASDSSPAFAAGHATVSTVPDYRQCLELAGRSGSVGLCLGTSRGHLLRPEVAASGTGVSFKCGGATPNASRQGFSRHDQGAGGAYGAATPLFSVARTLGTWGKNGCRGVPYREFVDAGA